MLIEEIGSVADVPTIRWQSTSGVPPVKWQPGAKEAGPQRLATPLQTSRINSNTSEEEWHGQAAVIGTHK